MFSSQKDSTMVSAFVDKVSPLLRRDSITLLFDESTNPLHDPAWIIWGVRLAPGITPETEKQLLDHLKAYDDVYFATPSYEADEVFHISIWLTSEFSVKLRDTTKTNELAQINSRFGITQRGDRFRSWIYYLEVPKALCRNSLEMSNYYFEHFRWLIEWVSPNWLN